MRSAGKPTGRCPGGSQRTDDGVCIAIDLSTIVLPRGATFNSEPFKPVPIQFSGHLEQDTRITRGNGPIQEQVELPLFLEASKPLHPLARNDTDDIGQIARAKASGDRQLHRLVEFLVLPLLLDPVAGATA